MPRIVAIHTAPVSALRIRRGESDFFETRSGIAKQTVSRIDDPRPVPVNRLGLAGDEQADLTVHGGLEKAVYAYPIEHYPAWRSFLESDTPLPYGRLGENLSTEGIVESELWIGDELQFPSCVLRLESPRRPCFKLNAIVANEGAGRFMLTNAMTGWYLSVVEPGVLRAGDPFTVKPGPRAVTLAERQRQMIRPTDLR